MPSVNKRPRPVFPTPAESPVDSPCMTPPALEAAFCRNFECCGLKLRDLHALLQHYEDCHVRYEEGIDGGVSLEDLTDVRDDGLAAFDTAVLFRGTKRPNEDELSELLCDPWLLNQQLMGLLQPSQPPAAFGIAARPSQLLVEKPYKCAVPGCDKSYKNPNGLKYHNIHGHADEPRLVEPPTIPTSPTKPYRCSHADCDKTYKNLNGLKYHVEHAHLHKKPRKKLPITLPASLAF